VTHKRPEHLQHGEAVDSRSAEIPDVDRWRGPPHRASRVMAEVPLIPTVRAPTSRGQKETKSH